MKYLESPLLGTKTSKKSKAYKIYSSFVGLCFLIFSINAHADRTPITVNMTYQWCNDIVCIDQFTICEGKTWSENRMVYLECTAPVSTRNVRMDESETVFCKADSVFYEDGATGIVCADQIQLVRITKDGFESSGLD